MRKLLRGNRFSALCLFIIGIAALAAFAVSCSKDNNMGPLRGQWQLLTIEYPDGNVVTPGPDGVRRYISFDQKVIQLTATDDSDLNFYKCGGNVVGETPDLTFNFPYSEDPAGAATIALWGIDENPAKVTVTELKGDRLVMKVGDNILTLRKF